MTPEDTMAKPLNVEPFEVEQAMVDFFQDAEQHWVAVLACGHRQHVRHRPPLVERHWVLSVEGRRSRLGQRLWCKHCEALKR